MKYTTFKKLNGKTLSATDAVILNGLEYKVAWNRRYLSLSGSNNGSIFKKLGIDKKQLAYKTYGYTPYWGDWPETTVNGDLEALTRLVLVLLLFAEGAEAVEVKVGNEWIYIDRESVSI